MTNKRLLHLLFLHVIVLVVGRLVLQADEFLNWDLISLVNANAFPSLSGLIKLPEVHLRQPFSFPMYITGTESIISLTIHRLMAPISLYWSNVVVLLVYDTILLVALYKFIRLVFNDIFFQCLAWILLAMSPILLTFMSTSAYVTEGYAVVLLCLLGTEYILASRISIGIPLFILGFLGIAQAYLISFYTPIFCLSWATVRIVSAPNKLLIRNMAVFLAVLAICVGVAQYGSTTNHFGTYWGRSLWMGQDTYWDDVGLQPVNSKLGRIPVALRTAFMPVNIDGMFYPGFAPYLILITFATLLFTVLIIRNRQYRQDCLRWESLCDWGLQAYTRRPRPKIPPLLQTKTLLTIAAWIVLIAVGYAPCLGGTTPKSQRCILGDIFLVMACLMFIQYITLHKLISRRIVITICAFFLCLSDGYYISAVASIDHSRPHRPMFDFDMHDGVVRHDLISVIKEMRTQVTTEGAGIILYYPRGYNENTTDPALFYGHLLRHFGDYRTKDIVIPCRFCDLRYGCPFPEIRNKNCRTRCCFEEPAQLIRQHPELDGRNLYLWWYNDRDDATGSVRQDTLLALGRRYFIAVKSESPLGDWTCYGLTPRIHKSPRARGTDVD